MSSPRISTFFATAATTANEKKPAISPDGKPIVRFYFDFDGTLTPIPGGGLVFTSFYKTCVGNYNDIIAVKNDNIPEALEELGLSADVILEKISDPNNNPKAINFAMRPEAIVLLKQLLSDNNDFIADIHFVSKNIAEYIIALLKHAEFTPSEIVKLSIHEAIMDKSSAIFQIEYKSNQLAVCAFAFDDTEKDLGEMRSGCYPTYKNEKTITFFVSPEGKCIRQLEQNPPQYSFGEIHPVITETVKSFMPDSPKPSA